MQTEIVFTHLSFLLLIINPLMPEHVLPQQWNLLETKKMWIKIYQKHQLVAQTLDQLTNEFYLARSVFQKKPSVFRPYMDPQVLNMSSCLSSSLKSHRIYIICSSLKLFETEIVKPDFYLPNILCQSCCIFLFVCSFFFFKKTHSSIISNLKLF